MKKIESYIQILIALGFGVCFAVCSIQLGWPASFTINYIKPIGTLFLNSLKMIAIPLVFSSLIVGITSIGDTTKFSRIGGKAFLLYAFSMVASSALGIFFAHLMQPGAIISPTTRDSLLQLYASKAEQHAMVHADLSTSATSFRVILDLIPTNFFQAMSNNANLLQIVIVAILLSIALIRLAEEKRKPVIQFFAGINAAIIELVRLIMNLAPIGVFALVSSLLIEVVGNNATGNMVEILFALAKYALTVILALSIMTFVLYPAMMLFFTKQSYLQFLQKIRPAQLLAFTASSTSAALPVTMECLEKKLHVPEEISRFVLPLGTSINMDGTAIYQGVSICFIAQALGVDLSLSTKLMLVANVTLASIGVASVPGGAMVATTIILNAIGIPGASLALILAPERILDMCRTVTNITGDAVVTVIVAHTEKKQ
jgi:Na+/H+-dicarboxylate symporter